MFTENKHSKYVPNAVFVDSEPLVIDQLVSGPRKQLYSGLANAHGIVSGKEDAADCFARGKSTVGKLLLEKTIDGIRQLEERISNPQGIVITHSISGGTGSGFRASLMNRIKDATQPVCSLCVLFGETEQTDFDENVRKTSF